MPSELPLEVRHELTRLRAIMYEPSSCWLATWTASERWLTDQFVMLDVTSSPALEDEFIADGGYKLVASKGFEPRELGWRPDLDVYFARMDELADWHPVKPSEWSVAEHPGKAMLWVANPGSYPFPCLLGESTWTAIKRNHPDCLVEYSEETNIFRFTQPQAINGITMDADGTLHGTPVEEGSFPTPGPPVVFCFAAGIRVPEGQEDAAAAIARWLDSTSNRRDDGTDSE